MSPLGQFGHEIRTVRRFAQLVTELRPTHGQRRRPGVEQVAVDRRHGVAGRLYCSLVPPMAGRRWDGGGRRLRGSPLTGRCQPRPARQMLAAGQAVIGAGIRSTGCGNCRPVCAGAVFTPRDTRRVGGPQGVNGLLATRDPHSVHCGRGVTPGRP